MPLIPDNDFEYALNVYSASNLIEEQIETLLYDFGGFIAAAGGNLGLFLGLSCLSMVFALVDKAIEILKL